MYERLHAAGIIHRSCGSKHWLRPDGAPVSALRLIDFGDSQVLDATDVPMWAKLSGRVVTKERFEKNAVRELSNVRRTLGF